MSGVIYQITCNATNLSYIGQATSLKYKQGKPYNYGASGRWSDHVSTSKTRNTPLCKAIKLHGREAFTINVLEDGFLETLDEREAFYIKQYNTVHPNGYNVATHSRNRHREESNLHVFYEGNVQSAIIAPIKRNGDNKLAYVYLTMIDGTKERIAFGQKDGSVFEETMQEVTEFLERLKCPYTIKRDVLAEKYASKLEEFKDKEVTSVRITSASTLIAVYVGTSDMKLSKDHKRVCFGGKTMTKEEAYENAKQFVAELHVSDKLIYDSIKSSQQATAE
jgi:hypothetical protein